MNDTYAIDVESKSAKEREALVIKMRLCLDLIPLQFKTNLPAAIRLDRKTGVNVEFDCAYIGWPQPRVVWLKGKVPLLTDNSTLQLRDNNGR